MPPSVYPPHEDLDLASQGHLDAPTLLSPACEASSSSAELLALAAVTAYASTANPFADGGGGLERKGSGVSRTTTASGDVQSVEAL